jgi:predicted membrane protein
MKMVIKFLGVLFTGLVLMQLADLAFYLMNRSDSYLFNMGLLVFGVVFVAFGYLGLYMLKVLKPEQEEEVKQKEENEL